MPRPPRSALAALLLLAAAALAGQGTGRIPQKVYGVEQGMASEVISALVHDRRGVIWAGTESGLHYFDGQGFAPHAVVLPSQQVLDLFADPGGRIWVGTVAGLAWIDGDRVGAVSSEQGLPEGWVRTVGRDALGHLWILRGEGLWVETGTDRYAPAPPLPGGAAPSHLFVHGAIKGAWVVADRKLWHWSESAGPGNWEPHPLPALAATEAVTGFALDGTGQGWLRTSARLWRRPPGGAWRLSRSGLEGGFSLHDRFDRDGSGWVWFHHRDGLSRARGETEEWMAPPSVEGRGALVDRDGGLWLRGRNGVARLLGGLAWRSYARADGLPSPITWQALRDRRGRFWVGTELGLCFHDGRAWRKVLDGRVLSILEGRDGVIWAAGSPGGVLHRIDPERLGVDSIRVEPLPLGRICPGIAFDGGGDLWMADPVRGLARGRPGPRGWRWEKVLIDGREPGLVTFLAMGPEGRIAVAYEGGVKVWRDGRFTAVDCDPKAGPSMAAFSADGLLAVGYQNRPQVSFHRVSVDAYPSLGEVDLTPGRPQTTVFGLAFQPGGALWVSTSRGVASLGPGQAPRFWGVADGLVSTDCNEGAIFAEADRIWIGTSHGLSRFEPGQEQPLPPLRAPELLAAQAGATALGSSAREWVLPGGARELSLHVLVPTYQHKGALHLQYSLGDGSGPWVDMEQAKLHFPALGPGRQAVRVRGVLDDGSAGPAALFRFQVQPRWWESWPGRAGFALLGAFALAGLVRLRQARLLARNRALVEEVDRQTRELQLASNAKSAFLAHMSHELRTPLNAILLYSELLQDGSQADVQPRIQRDAGRIHAAGKHLLALINDILDVSKIEAGQMELRIERVALGPLVEELVATLQPLVEQNRNRFILDLESAPADLWTDAVRLRQVLSNLLSNAAKFTHDGSVLLRVAADGPGTVRFVVEDTGIGIDPDRLGGIFREFVQAESDTARRFGGTGLGLALVKRFTELLGGTVSVASEVGKGSTFTVTLPAQPGEAAAGGP